MSLLIGVVTIVLGLLICGTVGMVAGYFRGRTATIITGVADVMLALPPLILALALVVFLGRGPNVVPPIASFALLAIAIVIVAGGALSFLGLSVESPTATWGNMISEGRQVLTEAPHVARIQCAAMFLTLLSFNFVGDRLRSHFNVKESGI